MDKLRIGMISYSNLYPIFWALRNHCDCSRYEFVNSYPSALNRMLREGAVDVSPSSSIEYLRDESAYGFIEGHSISSHGRIGSIFLFSRVPMESLAGHEVYATHQSETSVGLLRIILSEVAKITVEIKTTEAPINEALHMHSAYLSIGDEALMAGSEVHWSGLNEHGYRVASMGLQMFYVYDLGELWYKLTGKPFVFALWIFRRDLAPEKNRLLLRLSADLNRAKEIAIRSLPEIAQTEGVIMPAEGLVDYWRQIDYDLGDENLEGLELFRNKLKGIGMI